MKILTSFLHIVFQKIQLLNRNPFNSNDLDNIFNINRNADVNCKQAGNKDQEVNVNERECYIKRSLKDIEAAKTIKALW